MRIVGAVLVLLLAALPATAQHDAPAGAAAIRMAEAKAKKRAPPAPSRDQRGDPARRAHRHPARPGLDRRLQRPDQRRVHRQDDRGDQGSSSGNRKFKETGVLNPQERAAARRRREGEAGAGRLEHGRRPGHRRAARDSHQAGAGEEPDQDRHPLVVGAGADSGRDLPDQGAGHHAGGRARAAEEGARRPASSR